MTDQQTLSAGNVNLTARENDGINLKYLILCVTLISFGVVMTVFALAYTKDLQTLARAPELIWAFICGQPNEGGATLPLLLTSSAVGLLAGVGIGGWGWWSARRH